MKESVHLRTFQKGDFRVFSMLNTDDELIIALPHRVSITLRRSENVLHMDCDLGMTSSSVDFCRIGQIDISKPDYQAAVILDREFMARARSFENHFHVNKFIDYRNRYIRKKLNLPPSRVFGNNWPDQVYVHLVEPFSERKTNIEFSVLKSDYMDEEKLSEPIFTLCGSLELKGEVPHYFFFIDWFGDDTWLYEKHFFYNNTVFPPSLESLKPIWQSKAMAV